MRFEISVRGAAFEVAEHGADFAGGAARDAEEAEEFVGGAALEALRDVVGDGGVCRDHAGDGFAVFCDAPLLSLGDTG